MTLRTDFLRLMKIMEMMLGVVMGVVDMEVDMVADTVMCKWSRMKEVKIVN